MCISSCCCSYCQSYKYDYICSEESFTETHLWQRGSELFLTLHNVLETQRSWREVLEKQQMTSRLFSREWQALVMISTNNHSGNVWYVEVISQERITSDSFTHWFSFSFGAQILEKHRRLKRERETFNWPRITSASSRPSSAIQWLK